MITLFARREPSTDPVLRKYAPESKRTDVVIFIETGNAGVGPCRKVNGPDLLKSVEFQQNQLRNFRNGFDS